MRRFRAPALAAASAALGGARKLGALGEDSRPPPGPHEGLMGEPKILERKKFEPKTPSSKDRRPQGRGSEPPAITTRHDEYIKGIKIYGIGIKEDPVPGEKRGKGIQHLTSSYWIYDMGVFIDRNFRAMQAMVKYAHERCGDPEDDQRPDGRGFDFRYFINVSNALFLKSEAEGLSTRDGRDFFLMACWLAMAAAEVDNHGYHKYSREERRSHRDAFYQKYLSPSVVWHEDEEDDLEVEKALGKFAIEPCRIDLLPTVALERLGLHNELCSLKWTDPTKWMKEGFKVSARFDSMKRHYESVHSGDATEDHLAHLIWGFMALTHVIAVFPQLNDLTNFEDLRRRNVLEVAAKDKGRILALVGDGGFRPGIPGKTRQSGREPAMPGERRPA
eukprot:CAMPEP_0172649794 /NCGR_PEP_ID=MMETSP1068-20121228/241970_1 /TAXON_ID=35684 /ORGANISM="Pseudopedinella elastica, Strain CCMP716" /LENGTH=388 /DNA_ID=CAMNT_0013464155 /DNA_START=240 /DNA_END=1403 /DNA_ORIENTATION=-